MISTRILVRTCRCACYNSIKNGLQINSHKSQISSPILQRIPLHLPVVSCSTNIIKTEEKKTTQETKAFKDISFFRKIKHTLGFDRDLRVSYKKLELSAYRSWLCITELVDHDAFCEILDLPDTFNTWFLINELHLWIILTRLSFEGVEGRYFRNVLVSLMWKDTELRMKEVETVSFNERKEFLDQMKFHLQNAFLFYDEGLLSDDRALANALWNILFQKHDVSALRLELIVRYVRRQISVLDSMKTQNLLANGFIAFETLSGEIQPKKWMIEMYKNLSSIKVVPK